MSTKAAAWLSSLSVGIGLVGVACCFDVEQANAHAIVGNRLFPGTMAFDDPAVADEFAVSPSYWVHIFDSQSGFNVADKSVSWSFSRLLTQDWSVGISSGWIHRSGSDFPTQSGFDQTSVTLKHLLYRNAASEFMVSGSLSWGIGGSGASSVGARKPDTLTPGITFGKGFGDLPDTLGWLRPFAITGAVGLEVPTRSTSVNLGFDPTTGTFASMPGANVETLHWGFSIQYSTFYLTDRFNPGQLPKQEPLKQFVPLIEFTFDSPRGEKTAATMLPGVAYVSDVWQVSAAAIVPLNSQAGRGLGFRTQLLLFLDDLAPALFGKPLFSR